jgi:type IV pilus assembly protein PilY1
MAYFSTHAPKTPSDDEIKVCGANLGTARGYAVNFLDGAGLGNGERYSIFAGGGLPPSPVSGVVTLALTDVDGSPLKDPDGKPITASVPFVIGGGGGPGGPGENKKCGISGIDACSIEVNASGVRGRVFWYINTEQPE